MKGSLNNSCPGPPVFNNRSQDVESRVESQGNRTKVHVGQTTEIRLHDFPGVSVVSFAENLFPNAHLHSATLMHHQATRWANLQNHRCMSRNIQFHDLHFHSRDPRVVIKSKGLRIDFLACICSSMVLPILGSGFLVLNWILCFLNHPTVEWL